MITNASFFRFQLPLAYLSFSSIFRQTAHVSAHKMTYCNRGYCYTKNEPNPSSSHSHIQSRHDLGRQIKRTGFDFCTDREGHLLDCEILELMGKEDYMPMEDSNAKNKETKKAHSWEDWSWKTIYDRFNSNTKKAAQVKENFMKNHIPWETEPITGHCMDHDSGYYFDCKLIKNLDEGLVLIEDLRLGGIFSAQPKSGFTTRKNTHCQEPLHTPDVLCGSVIDPVEDVRTNIAINLEGM